MDVRDGFLGTIGNTPLIRLRAASEATGCEILGKAEFLNPGGSVKDRAAKYIILDAEERGDLAPGGVVVEGGEALALELDDTQPGFHRFLSEICSAKGLHRQAAEAARAAVG